MLENIYKKFTKDILTIGISSILVNLSGIILLPLLTKNLGVHDYGIWAQVEVTVGLAMGFVGLGLPIAIVRFLAAKTNKAEIQEEFYSVFFVVFLSTLALSLFMIIFPHFMAQAFFEGATQIVRLTGLIILMWSLDWVYLSLFRAFQQMKKYALFAIGRAFGEVGVIAYLVLNGHGIFGAVLSLLIVRGILLLILSFSIRSQIGIKRPRFLRIREHLSFGLPTIPLNMAAWAVSSSDRYVIGHFLGAASVGIYSAAYGLGLVIGMVSGILGFVLPPTLSKLYDEGRMAEVKTILSYSLKYSLALAIPFVFGAFILAQPVLRLFTTQEIADQGYFILPLIALSALFYAIYGVVFYILFLVKKLKIVGIAWAIAASVNLGLNILIVPRLGIIGAAIATVIAYLLALGIVTHYSFKEFRFDLQRSFIAKSLIASAVMSASIWQINAGGILHIIPTVVLGVIIYGAVLLMLKGFSKEEFSFIRELFRRA